MIKRLVIIRVLVNILGNDFDLVDVLDDWNDWDDGCRKLIVGGGGFLDKDFEDIVGGGEYKFDKGKGDGWYGSNDDFGFGMVVEFGIIVGVVSVLVMVFIGVVFSYIFY